MLAPPQGTWGQPFARMGPQGAVRHMWGPQGDPSGGVDPNLTSIRAKATFYLKLEETGAATREDSTANNLDFTPTNTPANASGKIGNACAFVAASSQYLSRASETAIEVDDVLFYMAAWINIASLAQYKMILSKLDNGGPGDYEFRVENTDVLDFFAGGVHVTHATALSISTWYLAEAYHDPVANEVGVALNGGAWTTQATAGANASTTNTLGVGTRGNTPGFYFDGMIDEVLFVKGATLTAGERAYLYNGGAGRAIFP